MTKLEMREYLAELETLLDRMLKKWKKESRIENGKAVQVAWQFEQSHIIMDVFWRDNEEKINLFCLNPHRPIREGRWAGLTKETGKKVIDMVGNFAQIVLSEPMRMNE